MNLGYGVLVFLTNPRRTTNRQYLVLSLMLGGWLACVWRALNASGASGAEFWIRQAFVFAALVPLGFHLLRLAIRNPEESVLHSARHVSWILGVIVLLVVVFQTPWFMDGVTMSKPQGTEWQVAEPQYGVGFFIFNVYFLTYLIALIVMFTRDLRYCRGVQKAEVQFVLVGCGVCISTGILLTVIIPALTGSSMTAPLTPICVIFLNAIIAYGIATRRIMGVATVLRRMTAYTLVTVYLVALYLLVLAVSNFVVARLWTVATDWPHLLAALVMAFSVAPAHGRGQKIAQRLFGGLKPIDVTDVVQHSARILQSIATLGDLLDQFGKMLEETFGTDRLLVLLASEEHGYMQAYPEDSTAPPSTLAVDSPLVRVLQDQAEPLVSDLARRRRLTPLMVQAIDEMGKYNAAVAVGIQLKGRLQGIMFLGERLSGRIYGIHEQDALHILGNELAVAVENSKLFTQTENGRIYNDILLDNLGSGVVAANSSHTVTVFNREAQRLTGLAAQDVIGRAIDSLPAPLTSMLRRVLEDQERIADQEVRIWLPSDEEAFARVTGSVFHGHTGETLGALLVFHDVTNVKRLEEQIRRSDRLASMGTLSAGMAHEIKNPLVTIKTFTQLLPERFDDEEFRASFTQLVGDGVKRIDGIVNQLLAFARPSRPHLTIVQTHTVLQDSLRLVEQELLRKNISVNCQFDAEDDTLMGDPDRLSQAFVNLFLNAYDAMQSEGRLTIATSVIQNGHYAALPTIQKEDARAAIRIVVRDTGAGIRKANLSHVFDPFFTTKSHGTGLGLAVSHGIVEEHGGLIDVESEEGEGTSFIISFPLTRKEQTTS